MSRKILNGEESDDDPFAPQDDDDENDDPFAVPREDDDEISDENVELDHDVENIDENESIDSDAAFGESDDGKFDKFTFRGSKENRLAMDDQEVSQLSSASDQDNIDDEEMSDVEHTEDELESDEDETEQDEDDRIETSEDEEDQPSTSRNREDLKANLSTEAKTLASSLSQAASVDARKGVAVKKQYLTFDRLLDARIKLQKGFAASNELTRDDIAFGSEADEALQKAQNAALQLYNTIDSFRYSLASISGSESVSKKRKRSAHATNLDDLDTVWASLQEVEHQIISSRRTTIDKWSNKAKASDPTRGATNGKSTFLDPTANDKLTAVLDTYIINEQDKYFRSQTNEVEDIGSGDEGQPRDLNQNLSKYDDALFYQSLLRDLITTRSATSSTNVSLPIVPQKLHPSGNRQNKNVKDTKASKGRKIRYTVHEKLQNFMAAEGDTGRDTAMWTERGKDEFFGSLFGQDKALAEDENEDMRDEETGDAAEVEALRLFTS